MAPIEEEIRTAKDFLLEFYRVRGIRDTDIGEKLRAIKGHVQIPKFDYVNKVPALYELEKQYLKDNGFNV